MWFKVECTTKFKMSNINLTVRTVWKRHKDEISYQIICRGFQFYKTMLTRFQFTCKVMWYTVIYRVIKEKKSVFLEVISIKMFLWTCVYFWMVRAVWISRPNSTIFFVCFDEQRRSHQEVRFTRRINPSNFWRCFR